MRKLIITTILSASASAFAYDLPFTVNYDESGNVETVVIAKKQLQAMDLDADVFVENIKNGIEEMKNGKSLGNPDALDIEGYKKLKKDERKAYLDAIQLIHSKSVNDVLDNKDLREQFRKAVTELKTKKLFYLVASPSHPGAFDTENILVEAVDKIIDVAQQLWGTTPVFNAFEFLVQEYFEALISRREFVQNTLLAYMDDSDTSFSNEDKRKIRSSVFYSRIDFYNLPKRKKAAKDWDNYGVKAQKSWMKKCKTNKSTLLHACYTLKDNKVYNLIDKQYKFSRNSSLAFDYSNPRSVAVKRAVIMAAKFMLKMLPAPGLVKAPVGMWLDSHYKQQRRTDGILYASGLMDGEEALARWVKMNTLNPTINF